MPKSEKAKIIGWFYRNEFRDGSLEFDDLLRNAASEALGKKTLDLDAYVYANGNRMWNALIDHISVDAKKGLVPLFTVTDRISKKITWYPFCKDIDSKKRPWALQLCKSRPAFLQKFDNLSDREYEALGCLITELAGAKEIKLTPASHDSGVDFFSKITIPGRTHIFSGEGSPIRVVGQSKKYAERVDLLRFDAFLTTLNEVRNLASSVKTMVPSWFIDTPGPIVGWVVAHNGFQSGVTTKARNNGVILSDSLDLAEIAARSRVFIESGNTVKRVNKLQENIKKILVENGV